METSKFDKMDADQRMMYAEDIVDDWDLLTKGERMDMQLAIVAAIEKFHPFEKPKPTPIPKKNTKKYISLDMFTDF